MIVLWSKFNWSVFLRVRFTISKQWIKEWCSGGVADDTVVNMFNGVQANDARCTEVEGDYEAYNMVKLK